MTRERKSGETKIGFAEMDGEDNVVDGVDDAVDGVDDVANF